jgi:hypothetical protein
MYELDEPKSSNAATELLPNNMPSQNKNNNALTWIDKAEICLELLKVITKKIGKGFKTVFYSKQVKTLFADWQEKVKNIEHPAINKKGMYVAPPRY